jgi:hypothetical protein
VEDVSTGARGICGAEFPGGVAMIWYAASRHSADPVISPLPSADRPLQCTRLRLSDAVVGECI